MSEKSNELHVAVLDDDPEQLELMKLWLERANVANECFLNSNELFRALRRTGFDCYLVDWELPDDDGMSVLERLRSQQRVKVPIIFTTARSDHEDIARALRAGADDYLVKPINEVELIARIEACSRRAGLPTQSEYGVVSCHNLELNVDREEALLDSEALVLSRREFDLLLLMLRHVGNTVPREQILADVWGIRGDIATRTVDTHISRLRHKLKPEDGGSSHWHLDSVPGVGYRMRYEE